MNKRYTGSNPLDAVPQPEWQRDPVQGHTEPPEIEFDWNPHSKSNIMARRASALIREKYRIEAGDCSALARHDNEMRRIWHELMEGTYQPPESVISPRINEENKRMAYLKDPKNWR